MLKKSREAIKRTENSESIVYSREPKYTVKDISEMLGLTKHTIRYYDNENLIPYASRSGSNIRLFSDYDIQWFKTVNCLRYSGLSILQVKEYIKMCLQGDETILERAKIIFQQEKILEEKAKEITAQLEMIKYKKAYYEKLLVGKGIDKCNPFKEKDHDIE